MIKSFMLLTKVHISMVKQILRRESILQNVVGDEKKLYKILYTEGERSAI